MRCFYVGFIKQYGTSLADQMGWRLVSFEKVPKYDNVTEFMNVALIPLAFGILILMYMLAYFVSNLRFVRDVLRSFNTGNVLGNVFCSFTQEMYMVIGTQKGKNVAAE